MTTMRRLFPAAVATAALAAAAAPADAALNPVFGDSAPFSGTSAALLTTEQNAASSHGRVVAIYLDNPSATGTLRAVRLDSSSGSWSTETISGGSTDVGGFSARIAADSDGNMTAIWREDGTGSLRARTLLKGEQSWGTETVLSTAAGSPTIEPGANGTITVAWGEGSAFKVRTREAGSENWLPTVDALDVSPHYANGAALAINASGDAVLVGDTNDGATDKSLRAARFDHQTGNWTPAASPITSWSTSEYLAWRSVAVAPDGSALTVWVDPAAPAWAPVNSARASYSAPGSTNWSAPETLTASGHHALLPSVVADRNGNFVASFQSVIDDGSDMLAQIQTSRAITRTRSATSGAWSEPEMLMGDRYGGAVDLTVDGNHNIAAIMLSDDALDTSRMGDAAIVAANIVVAYRPDGEQDFGAADTIFNGDVSVNGSMPGVALDEHGNAVATFTEALTGTDNRLRVTIGDATGPELNDLSVPSSGTVGDALTFSVNPFDRFSSVDATSWSFGEGADATGSTVTHAYENPGTYTVTVTSSDLNGQTTSETRTITIAEQPADEPTTEETTTEPKKTLAPVIEARLSGKTITLTARLTLRTGKKCSGKATARTRFGTTTYRTTLKLATVNGKCVGTGKIKLKKTPSTRTKLRVTVSAKNIKTRTLTTKRA